MNIQEAVQKLHESSPKPVYLVLGTELYLQETAKKAFLQTLGGTVDDFNVLVFDMEETPISAVVGEAETLPFFGDHRMIFVENPYFLTGEKKSGGPEHNLDELLAYLKAPLETTILVFFAPYEKLDERKKVTKELKKHSELINVQPLQEKELRDYLFRTLENDGYTMSKDAVQLFLRLTNFNLTKVMGELDKLMLFATESKKISVDLVRELVPKTLEDNIFELTDYVLKKDSYQALQTYDELKLQGEEPIKLMAILINQLRLLLQTKILMNVGYQQSNIAKTLSIHPYRVKLAMQQVKQFPMERLSQMFDELVENDYLIKTGQLDKDLAFQLFVLKAGQ